MNKINIKLFFLLLFINIFISGNLSATNLNLNNVSQYLLRLINKSSDNAIEKFCDSKEVKPELLLERRFDSLNLMGLPKVCIVQGFCCDGLFFYLALTTLNDVDYINTETVLLKLDMKNNNIIKKQYLGKIGHSSSLAYNPFTKSIYIAPASSKMNYIIKVHETLDRGIEKIFLKYQNNTDYKEITNLDSLSYNYLDKTYQIRKNNRTLSIFDSDFKFIRDLNLNYNCRINGKISKQVFTCDGGNYFSVCNHLRVRPIINYIVIYDLNGKHIKDIRLEEQLTLIKNEKVEFEQLANYNNEYFMLAQCKNSFRIYKLNLKR